MLPVHEQPFLETFQLSARRKDIETDQPNFCYLASQFRLHRPKLLIIVYNNSYIKKNSGYFANHAFLKQS